ncbi:hypothetical protein MNBD_ALPHA06-1405 [hydrothermal vent metagenome]|uniref:DUF465 domain-containing protein n=1 Tax=hydrothermal vent metagenome TaxID=652676 RepID=A0A3B0R713_9ZZZZ
MTMQARIKQLDHKHATLQTAINNELKHPAHDPMHITELKRQKLRLKEQLIRLRQQN